MGGSPNLLMPVNPTYTASWFSHTRRSPKSSEPGTDMFVPIGTPVYAPGDGVVYGSGNTIGPATGRWVGIDLDNGMRFRCMHLSRLVNLPRRVTRGALIGYSGASGYGYEDWSRRSDMPAAHTHVTLWPSHVSRFGYDSQGRPFTIDFMANVGGSSAGGATPVTPATPESGPEEDDMKLLYVTDSVDGNGVPGWALLNTRTGKLLTLRNTVAGAQDNANSWARVWGKSLSVSRQDMLNAVAAIQKTV